MSKCIPGMKCFDIITKTTFSDECNPCSTFIINSGKVEYTGPNLPCTGINTYDNLELSLQKIDNKMCSEELVSNILLILQNNSALKTILCSIISSC